MMAKAPRICIVMPYFGQWPQWMELFLETCRWNPGIEWRFFSDCGTPPDLPGNVTIEPMTLPDLLQEAERALAISIKWRWAYKLCDIRPAYGTIFRDAIEGFDYFGWGDLDVIYGGLESYLTERLPDHDCICFYSKHLSGHLCLFKNDDKVREWYRRVPDWRSRMESEEYTHMDEISPDLLRNFIRVYARESYNTPLSPLKRWTDGTFDFPSEWYWKDGTLTNDKDGNRSFPHLHFMHWKGGPWPRQCGNAQWERLDEIVHLRPGECKQGFRVNERGFFPLLPDASKPSEDGLSETRPIQVSIILPVHNAASAIGSTLESLRDQSYPHWEAIIVDDGSTDDSLSLARAAAETDPRYRVLSQDNRGASAARNTGIAHATSEWLLFLDADDWIAPNHLQVMTAALSARPELDAVVCKWIDVYKDEQHEICSFRDLDNLFAQTIAGSAFAIHACIIRKRVVDRVGGFNEELRACNDRHFWHKVASTGARFGSVDEALAFYRRQSSKSLSKQADQVLQDALTVFRMGLADTDPAVKCQQVDRSDPRFAERLAATKYCALIYWGTAMICNGKSADPYWAHIEDGLECKMRVPTIANLVLRGMVRFQVSREVGLEIWQQNRIRLLEFLERLEAFTGIPRLAARVARKIALSLLESRPGGSVFLVEGFHGVSIEALSDISDDTAPADEVEAVIAAVTVAGRPVGSVCLPSSGGRVTAEVIKDAVSDRFALDIIRHIMADPAEGKAKPRQPAVHAAAFCAALLGGGAEGSDGAGGSFRLVYDGSMPLAIELTDTLPDIIAATGEEVAIAASLGGTTLGIYRIPVPGGQVSGKRLGKVIRTLFGIDLARACLRQAVVGQPPASIEEVRQRLRRQAEGFDRQSTTPRHQLPASTVLRNRLADVVLVQPDSPKRSSAGIGARLQDGESAEHRGNQSGWVRSLPILAYRRIAPPEQDQLGQSCVSPDEFARQLAFLNDAGFYTIGWQSLQVHHHYSLPLPGRPIVLTFDDGYKDFAEIAFPALQKHGFSATVFVCPALVGGRNVWDGGDASLLDWADIRELADNLVSFGSRGLTHERLTWLSTAEAGVELTRSKQVLEDRLGSEVAVLSYPYGDVDPLIEQLAGAAGYIMGVTTVGRQCRLSDRLMSLPRLDIHGGMSFEQFVLAVTHQPDNSDAPVQRVCKFLEDINRPDLALATARDRPEAQ